MPGSRRHHPKVEPKRTWDERAKGLSVSTYAMECRGVPILPTYAQACGDVVDVSPLPRKRSLCHTLFAYRTLNDPVIILITLAVVVGSFCLLSGFILLCVVSKAWQDETSEAILLMGIGFFITSLSCVSWKLTRAQRLTQIVEAINDRDPTEDGGLSQVLSLS